MVEIAAFVIETFHKCASSSPVYHLPFQKEMNKINTVQKFSLIY